VTGLTGDRGAGEEEGGGWAVGGGGWRGEGELIVPVQPGRRESSRTN